MIVQKHFLETSVARSMLTGSGLYKRYFREQFSDGQTYTSPYVGKEITTSYLCKVINFYFTLRMESMQTVGDALSFWTEKFAPRDIKATQQLIGHILDTHELSEHSRLDKPKMLEAIRRYVFRFRFLRQLGAHDIGKDSTGCARAKVILNADAPIQEEELERFMREINDLAGCRSRCHVDQFFLTRYKTEMDNTLELSNQTRSSKQSNGFLRICAELESVVKGGADKCSCKKCDKIGDAIIAFDAPRDMRLEHTDHAFDFLCEAVKQDHFKHPSHKSVVDAAQSAIQKSET